MYNNEFDLLEQLQQIGMVLGYLQYSIGWMTVLAIYVLQNRVVTLKTPLKYIYFVSVSTIADFLIEIN